MGRNRKKKRRLRAIMAGETDFKRKRKKESSSMKKKSSRVTKEETFDYKARTRVLPEEYPTSARRSKDDFVTSRDKEFRSVLKTSYAGFCVDERDRFPKQFHDEFSSAFEQLERDGVFLYDVTQPRGLGTPCARTFVKRTLLGVPGITYKYLGLRMFAIPWNDKYRLMEKLNSNLVRRTKSHLKNMSTFKNEPKGPCEYNLTLINRMEPLSRFESELKNEPMFSKEKCSVSWHADSTLQHFSSIAVYHKFYDEGDKTRKPWKIGLRVACDSEGPTRSKLMTSNDSKTPPVAIDLPNSSAYYMMDDFNHHHQHAVIAGDTLRYASTHRVCRVNGHTVQSVLEKCRNVLNRSGKRHTIKQWRSEQFLLDELEFEWIRQWFVQGKRHAEIRVVFWQSQIQELIKMWIELESRTRSAFEVLRHAVEDVPKDEEKATIRRFLKRKKKASLALKEKNQLNHLAAFDLLIEHLSKRHEKRVHWQKRYEDPAFQKVAKDCRPMTLPIFRELNGDVSLGESLNGSISQVHDFRARYELILKKRS